MVKIIVAYDCNRVIGNDNKIPWHIKEDVEHFKNTTSCHAVVIGRKTWDSIPTKYKPLIDRVNIIITRSVDKLEYSYSSAFAEVYKSPSLEEAIKFYAGTIFICGGEQIYKESLNKGLVDSIIATEIFNSYEGDTYFPILDDSWESTTLSRHKKFNIVEYKRIIK